MTFGCFNNSTKISDKCIDTWSKILIKIKDCKLIIKASSKDSEIAQKKNLLRFRRPKTSFIDKSFTMGSRPIYAIASVDAHGMTSNYSSQISVYYDKIKNRMESKLVSREGAPKPYPNIYLEEDTFKDNIKVSSYDRMHVFFDPEYYDLVKSSPASKTKSGRELDTILKSLFSD